MATSAWNEKLSDELKKLNLAKNPTAAQKARIAALQGIKTGAGKTVTNPINKAPVAQSPVQQAGNFTDPAKVAAAEVAANRPNESNAFGSRQYDPTTGAITDTLSQGQQGLLDAQTQTGTLGSNVAGGLLQGLQGQGAYDPSKLQQYMPQGSDQARQATYDATYGQLTKDTAKNKARDQASLEQRLADQGIPVGSKQYNDQMGQFNTRYDDIEANARQQAVTSGNAAFDQSFQQGQTTFGNQQGLYQSGYSMPASIAGQLQGLGQVQQPTFGQGVAPVDFGSYYQTATGANLKEKELAKMGSGGSGGGVRQAQAPSPNYPTMGGVAGAGVATGQPRQPGAAGTLGNAVVGGLTQGAAGQLMR